MRKVTIGFLVAAFLLAQANVVAGVKKPELQELYDQWKKAVAANPILTEPMLFPEGDTKSELGEAASGMRARRFEMAEFLCDKVADQTEIEYFDAWLFFHVVKIYLFHTEGTPAHAQDVGKSIKTNFAKFKAEWKAGLYKDPSEEIARLCEERLARENRGQIEPNDLLMMRRFGVFGIPALIEQIKDRNSKHAFAALLVTLEDEAYSSYPEESEKSFMTKEAKIKKVEEAFSRFKGAQKAEDPLMKKISAALRE